MPRFFFDLHDGKHQPVDLEGIELVDARAAGREAATALKQAIFMSPDEESDRAIACHVRDESGRVIYRTALSLIGGWVPAGGAIAEDP